MTDSIAISNGSAVVGALLEGEPRALRLQVQVQGGKRAQVVKVLHERRIAHELVRQQCYGRYPFELLQTVNHASGDVAGARRVRLVLTETALIIANMGWGFGESEVRAVAGLNGSSKDPRKSIGYKGLGFKAIGEITDLPQIFSPPHCFGFDAGHALEVVHDAPGQGGCMGRDVAGRRHQRA
ncbi:hypothetical protein AB0383_16355 [Amycolatopsis sp. NPDC051373]|uniref:hypothetical protein n=1 Tax=Amycolatopsis sp. NPDC051373 TaxID=3155801 RepID=UPI00344EF673